MSTDGEVTTVNTERVRADAVTIARLLRKVDDDLRAVRFTWFGGLPFVEREKMFAVINAVADDVFGDDLTVAALRNILPSVPVVRVADDKIPDAVLMEALGKRDRTHAVEVTWRVGRQPLLDEIERLTALTSVCSCYDGNPANYDGNPANYEGWHADCPIHGAIRAFNDATRELAEARAENAALDEAMHTVWLDSGKWRWTTSCMTTEAREAAVAAVLRFDRTMKSADPDDEFLSRDSLAWWDDRRAVGQPEEVPA